MTDQNKPVLDEQTFEKLLQAAYVLQEHNRKMRELEESLESQSEQLREQELANQSLMEKSKPEAQERSRSNGDYTLTLAQIVEAQHQIQMRHLELEKAIAVVAERVARIIGASGAGIGILDGTVVRYRGGAGSSALPAGSEIPLKKAICQANIRTGQVIRSQDVNTEILFDSEPCLRRGILSLVSVPIYHDSDIVGALELYFDKINGFAEQDIHTCQLMAGLVTEAISRDAELNLKNAMVAERSTMIAAMEKLKPDLAALAEDPSVTSLNVSASAAPPVDIPCWKCGNNLVAEEQFCGKCGASRASGSESSGMQSKIASAWHRQTASAESFAAAPADDIKPPERFSLPNLDEPELEGSDPGSAPSFAANADEDAEAPWLSQSQSPEENTEQDEQNIEALSTVLAKPRQEEMVWSSAAKARDFLESLSATRRTPGALAHFWRSRRGDFYLAIAIILVLVVIRWGIWSNSSVGATGHGIPASTSARSQPAADADLSLFDKFLIALGLAEAPDPPQYRGNPSIQVWVDLHTALYYCPGSDLYGKTPRGKLTSQRDAQLDQFEPANRKACD